jgi:hypothetical protein
MAGLSRLLLPALLLPCAAAAQDAPQAAALPDPTTIATPDVTPSKDPAVRKEGYKFYYFYNSGVSFAQAYQDLKECRAYFATGGAAQVPGFIPWDEAHRRKTMEGNYYYQPLIPAIVTAGMAAIIVPKMERGLRSNKMRRCMGTRGYDRYAIPEKAWNTLNDGDEEQLVRMQAKLASGPKPQDEAVTE